MAGFAASSVGALASLFLACSTERARPGDLLPAKSSEAPAALGTGPAARAASSAAKDVETTQEACAASIARVSAEPGSPPADWAPLERGALLAQVKATPVVFIERPRLLTTDPVARQWRHELDKSELPGRVLARLLRSYRRFPAFLREVLLTDGYVFAETAPLGATLAEGLTLGMLFREPRLVIERGATRLLVETDELGGYRYVDGPDRGKSARLVLFDRVFVAGLEPGPPRHVDLSRLRDALGFDTFSLAHVAPGGLLGTATYGAHRVPTLLTRTGATLGLTCEVLGENAAAVRELREEKLRHARAVERLRDVILSGVDESLPFDEPRTEFGQEDGKLRQRWREAYFQGAKRYEFNGDKYAVFDGSGRALVPQVCIDFIVDTFERAGGAWYASEAEPRSRRGGRIDFDGTGVLNRRNVEEFIALARRRPDWFELRPTPPEEQVRLERRDRFLQTLFEHRGEYQPGDVVVILGPRADEKLHYHSFFVFDADPATGMPTLVAGNSGRPRVRAFTSEMASAPKRSLFARVRPRFAFLAQTLENSDGAAPRPLTAEAEPLRSPATP